MSRNKQFGLERQRLVAKADILFSRAETAESLAGISESLGVRWRSAAKTFEKAALLYRQAGLGLLAKVAYSDASEAYAKAGRPNEAEKCKGLAEAVPVYYEEEI